jgi:hypothetical protein
VLESRTVLATSATITSGDARPATTTMIDGGQLRIANGRWWTRAAKPAD